MRWIVAAALFAFPLGMQAQSGTVSPGMNRTQVVASLGEPATARTANEFTYLFYRNDCGKSCGMNDIVILRRDSVIDAIFRSPSRHYTGTSSSPEPINHAAARTRPARPAAKPVANPTAAKPAAKPAPLPVTKDAPAPATKAPATQLKPSAPNDTHPSVPAGEPPVKKAPATATPATPTSTRPPAQ